MSGEMYRLTAVGIVLLAVVPNAHARLCVKGNGTVASREACRRHEHEISIATLLPAARASLVTLRNGPIALAAGAQGGTKVAELALPSGERESTGNYVILAIASLVNHRTLADTASCFVVVQSPGRSIPVGLQLTNYSTLVLDGTTSANATLLGELPDVNPSSLQNGSGTIALWCSAAAPESEFTADTASLLAIPVEQLQTQ